MENDEIELIELSKDSKLIIRDLLINKKEDIVNKILNYLCGYLLVADTQGELYRLASNEEDGIDVLVFPSNGPPYHPKIRLADLEEDNGLVEEDLYYIRRSDCIEFSSEIFYMITEKFFQFMTERIIEEDVYCISEFIEENDDLTEIRCDLEAEVYNIFFKLQFEDIKLFGSFFEKLIIKEREIKHEKFKKEREEKIKIKNELKQRGKILIHNFIKNVSKNHKITCINLSLSGDNKHNTILENELENYTFEDQIALVLNFNQLSNKYKNKYNLQ